MITFPRFFKPTVGVRLKSLEQAPLVEIPPTDQLRIVFEVRKTIQQEPDTATLQIYGIDDITRKAWATYWSSTGRGLFDILAGYEFLSPILAFNYDIRSTTTRGREGQDWITTVAGDDGGDAIAEVGVNLPGGYLTAAQMVTIAIAMFAQAPAFDPSLRPITIVQHPSVAAAIGTSPAAQTPFQIVKVSKATDLLDEAARLARARWYIRGGLLYFSQFGLPTDPVVYQIPQSHWLAEPSDEGKGLLKLSVVADPNIQPGGHVGVWDRIAPYSYDLARVEACTFKGDTDFGMFTLDLVLRLLASV